MSDLVRTVHVLEPSKVGYQHIFVIGGYLRALHRARPAQCGWDIVFWGSRTTISALPRDVLEGCSVRHVPVMDPQRKRLVRKCLLEALVVLWRIARMRPEDMLIITCLLSPSLLLVQVFLRLFPRRCVHVVLHGELEWVGRDSFEKLSLSSVGYWARKWMATRTPSSHMDLIVLADFIRRSLLQDYGAQVPEGRIRTIRPPIVPTTQGVPCGEAKICFIGFRTRFKSFDDFLACAREGKHGQFVAIGGGVEVDVRTGKSRTLTGNADYLEAISKCDIAVFPYRLGYSRSLSASALDALVAGVYIAALDVPCFRALAECLGPSCVTVCHSVEEIGRLVSSLDIERLRSERCDRLAAVENSLFGLGAVSDEFKLLLDDGWLGSVDTTGV